MACQRWLSKGRHREQKYWNIICLLLRAAHYHRVDMNDSPLHAAVSLCVPFDVTRKIMTQYPNDFSLCDKQGNYPLHLALASPPHANKSDMILSVLEAYPPAATAVTLNGQSTLDIAARASSIQPQVLRELILANPCAFGRLSDGLYPFATAALPKEHDDVLLQTTNIFTLLLAAPDLVLRGR